MVKIEFDSDKDGALPAGTYEAMICSSRSHETANGDDYLVLDFVVTSGEHQGKSISSFFGLEASNLQARAIARGRMAQVCVACGVKTPQDSSELHNIPMIIEVKHGVRKDTGDTIAEIKKFAKISESPQNETPSWMRENAN